MAYLNAARACVATWFWYVKQLLIIFDCAAKLSIKSNNHQNIQADIYFSVYTAFLKLFNNLLHGLHNHRLSYRATEKQTKPTKIN